MTLLRRIPKELWSRLLISFPRHIRVRTPAAYHTDWTSRSRISLFAQCGVWIRLLNVWRLSKKWWTATVEKKEKKKDTVRQVSMDPCPGWKVCTNPPGTRAVGISAGLWYSFHQSGTSGSKIRRKCTAAGAALGTGTRRCMMNENLAVRAS